MDIGEMMGLNRACRGGNDLKLQWTVGEGRASKGFLDRLRQ